MPDVMLTKGVQTELQKHNVNQAAFEDLIKSLMQLTGTQSASVTVKTHSASNKTKIASGYLIFLDYKEEIQR